VGEIPLSQHALLRSSNLDETARHVEREFSVHRLEFATGDRRLNARLHAVPHPRVTPIYLTYGAEVVNLLDVASPYLFVLLPLSGQVLVNGDQPGMCVTRDHPAVVSPPETPTLRWRPDTAVMVFRIDRKSIESELVNLLYEPVDEPLRFQFAMDLTRASVCGWADLAMTFANELGREGGIAKNPLIANDMERILIRGLLLSQPHNYTSKLADLDMPSHVVAAIAVMEDSPAPTVSTGSVARKVGVSTRSLQAAFRESLRVTPQQYMRQVRLQRAHEDLLANKHRNGTTVSTIANHWGFSHLGRFANEYRSRYGQSPSQTLRGD